MKVTMLARGAGFARVAVVVPAVSGTRIVGIVRRQVIPGADDRLRSCKLRQKTLPLQRKTARDFHQTRQPYGS